MRPHLYVESEKAELMQVCKNDIYQELRGGRNEEILTKGYKLLVIRWLSSRDPRYSMVTTVNSTTYLKTEKRVSCKCSYHQKEKVKMWGDGDVN